MDQKGGLHRGLQRHLPDEATSAQSPALELQHLYSSQLTQINDSVYSLPFPEGKRPSVEIVLFHGLQLEGSHGAYITSWISRSQSNPELWVKWILEDDQLEDARILFISYDAHVRKTNEEGRLDMHNTCENLISDLIHNAEVGQDGCPVILVGHCLGGVLVKELCVQAQDRLGRWSQDTINPGVQNFLANVQGFLFYGSPHRGTELADISTFSKSPLFKDLTTLNNDAARRNEAFRELRRKYGWRTFGIGETVPVNLGGFEGLVVKEGSAREDMGGYYSDTTANHFNVCRPESRNSSSFCKLKDFVSEIVEEDKSRQGPTMKTSDFGLESQVNQIRHKLLTSGVQRLGIVGMGGIGKTTLAKVVFNAILGYFDYTCFLMEVQKKAPDSLRNDIKGSLYFRGRPVAEAFKWSDLKKKRILLVLDDITDESHLQVITEDEFLSSQNCMVIVTARDRGLLRPEDFECHSVRELDPENSKKLFCKYAFKEAEPQYESLVQQFLQKCDGLPLAIEVAGKYLYKKCETEWIENLGTLGSDPLRGNKSDKLTSILNMSYDDLAPREKEMFLDVAHGFHGQRLSTVKQIWRICGREGYESGWGNLVDKGLVKEVPDPKWWEYPEGDRRSLIQMHEFLRDLGHSKPCPDPLSVSGSSQGKPPIHLHRWNPSPSIPWREDMEALEIVECKYLVFLQRSVGQLERLKHLKISNCADLEAVPESVGLLSNLRYLSIQNCGKLSALPESLGNLKNLRRVTIWGCSKLGTLPESLSRLGGLEYLAIGECDSLGVLPESLGKLRSLEHLTIEKCHGLETLPTNLGELPVLKHLEICDCSNLHTLPASTHLLPALQRLALRGCSHLEILPNSLGLLQSLKDLTLERCYNLRSLPASLGQLRSLQHLTLEDCWNLVSLPDSVRQLRGLRQLIIKCCSSLGSLLWTFGWHEDLQHVTIKECTSLKFLPFGWPGALEQQAGCHVTIEGCPIIEDVQNLKHFTVICQRASLDHLPMSIGDLRDLEHLTIQECPSLEHLPENIGRLGALKHLTIQQCQNLKELPESIEDLRDLEHLTIRECPSLRHLPENIGRLGALKHLTLQQCQNLKELPKSIGDLRDLEHLTIRECWSLRHLPENIGRLRALKHLTIQRCMDLKELPESIGDLRDLEHLTVRECWSLRHLPENIARLGALKQLTIKNCQRFKRLPEMLPCECTVTVVGSPILEMRLIASRYEVSRKNFTTSFEDFRTLKDRTMQDCEGLEGLPEFIDESTTSLSRDIEENRAPTELTIDGTDPGHFVQLEGLTACIQDLRPLKRLTIQGCDNVRYILDVVGRLQTLEYLTIRRCSNLKELPERVGELRALQHLTIEYNEDLEHLPKSIGNLSALKHLTVQGCPRLRAHPESIQEFRLLRKLTIQGVNKSAYIPGLRTYGRVGDDLMLQELPRSIGDLRALEHLTLGWTRVVSSEFIERRRKRIREQ